MEGTVRRLILKNCQLDQAGEVSYQALNAVTSAMLNVKGKLWFKELGYCFPTSCKNRGEMFLGSWTIKI